MALKLLAVFLFAVIVALAAETLAAKKSTAAARREDIPYIRCDVCEHVAEQLQRQVNEKRNQITPKQLSEYEIIEVAENICNLKRHEGDWLLHLDIVEIGDKLKLVEQEEEGECNAECKTIERACQEVIGYHDTDVAEFLFKSRAQRSTLSQFLCNDLSRACSVKPPPVPKDRAPGEPFVPKSSKKAEMEKIMRSMSDMPGAPSMKMYSRDDLMNMQNFGGDDEDEDEEEDYPVSNLRNLKKSMQSGKSSWKKSLVDKAQSTLVTFKKQSSHTVLRAKRSFHTVSNKIKKWFKGLRSDSKNSKSSQGEL